MIGYRPTAHPLLRGRSRPSDIEALQTDVMRFMAILGLCLTAIFALVQTLPAEQAQRQAEAQLQRKLEARQQQLEQARAELDRLAGELQAADQSRLRVEAELQHGQQRRQQAERELARLNQANAEARRQKQALEGQLNGTREQLARAESERDRLELEQGERARVLQQLGQQLDRVQRESKQRQRDLTELERKVIQEQQKLERIVRQTPPQEAPEEPEMQPEEVSLSSPVAEQETSDKEGFLLRFASAEALERLVRSGVVGFTGMLGQDAWSLSLNGGSAVFVKHSPPRKIHEMTAATVPLRYIRAFQTAAGAGSLEGVIWGVQLPADMEQEIHSLMGRSAGGELVIQPDGEVVLEGGRT